jgi:hypothetical protein
MFEVGKIYNRRADIHDKYKGKQQGGICTPQRELLSLRKPERENFREAVGMRR